jgi:hypothetical protein
MIGLVCQVAELIRLAFRQFSCFHLRSLPAEFSTSTHIVQTTLFSKELPYDKREEVIQVSPEYGDDWTMCVLVENSAGRLRRWKQENCRKASLISSATWQTRPIISGLWITIVAVLLIH